MAEIINQMHEECWSKSQEIFCDSAEPDRIQMLVKAGYRAVPVKKGAGSVKAQIDWLKGVIDKNTACRRKIYIHPDCTGLAKEIQEYRWKLDLKSNTYLDEPVEFNDDAIAALRYSIERLRQPQIRRGF